MASSYFTEKEARQKANRDEAFNDIQRRLPLNTYLGEGYSDSTRPVLYIHSDNRKEELARVTLKTTSWSVDGYKLTSKRIRDRRGYSGGSRRYKSIDSLMKGIKEFAVPVSKNEKEYEALSLVIENIERRIATYVRRLATPDYELREAVALMASSEFSKASKGQEMLRNAVKRQRKVATFNRRARLWITAPLSARKKDLK